MKNVEGEWCVVFYGVGLFENLEGIAKIVGNFYEGSVKPSLGRKCTNVDDKRNPGNKCILGICYTSDIE